jgi:hypothetical protein
MFPGEATVRFPARILKKIRKDGVMSRNKLFSMFACHASGIRIRKRDSEKITGQEKKAVRIKKEKEGGDWIEDSEEVSNMICHVGNIHPGPAGAAPGKSKNSFSGSVQRGLFTVKQASENPTTIFYRSRYLSSKNIADRRISPATSR